MHCATRRGTGVGFHARPLVIRDRFLTVGWSGWLLYWHTIGHFSISTCYISVKDFTRHRDTPITLKCWYQCKTFGCISISDLSTDTPFRTQANAGAEFPLCPSSQRRSRKRKLKKRQRSQKNSPKKRHKLLRCLLNRVYHKVVDKPGINRVADSSRYLDI